jgi:hypothetical protein
MWHLLQTRTLSGMSSRRSRGHRTATVAIAVLAIAGLMFASVAPASAKEGYDWDWWSDNWESDRDAGGWDAIVLLSYSRNGYDWWITTEFSAYGERLYSYNSTSHEATIFLSADHGYELDKEFTVVPGECITWGWGNPPPSLAHCHDLGGRDIPEDLQVTVQVCGHDPSGATCHGEVAES